MSTVTVLTTSDLHAHLTTADGGIARVLAAVADRDRDRSVLVDNGDLLTGSALGTHLAMSDWTDGHPLLAALEDAGYDVAVPGNHDLDHGVERLRAAVARLTTLQYVCANLVDDGGAPVFARSAVLDRDGLQIGVIGAVTSHAHRLSRYASVRGVHVLDAVEEVAREAQRIRPSVDVLVVAYHGGFARDPATGQPMHYDTGEDQGFAMLEIEGVDGVIAGHQHWLRAGEREGCAYVQTGYGGSHVGRLRFTFEGAQIIAREAAVEPVAAYPPVEVRSLDGHALAARILLRAECPLTDHAILAVVAARSRCDTVALALPAAPRTWRALAAAFDGAIGASVLRLPRSEAEAAMDDIGRDVVLVTTGWDPAAIDVEIVMNAALVSRTIRGRIVRDLVVDWLDEFAWAVASGRSEEW